MRVFGSKNINNATFSFGRINFTLSTRSETVRVSG